MTGATSKIKPCPFCNAELTLKDGGFTYKLWSHPENDCFHSTLFFEDRPEVVERWNTRMDVPRKCCQNCRWSNPIDVKYCDNPAPCDNYSEWESI